MTETEAININKKAGFYIRLSAFFIDMLLISAVSALLIYSFLYDPVDYFLRSRSNGIILLSIYILFFDLYFTIFEWLCNGQTPGKWISGIKVVKAGGLNISFTDALIRNLFRCTFLFPLIFFIPDLICYLLTKEKRIGDIAAGTTVIKADS